MKIKLSTFKDIGILFLWIFASVYASNYFFFKHASRDVDRDIIHLAKSIKTFTSYCMETKADKDICVKDLKTFIIQTPVYYKAAYLITDNQGNLLFQVGKIDTQDKSNSIYDLSFIQENKHLHRFQKLFSTRKFNLSEKEIDDLSQLYEIDATLNIQKYAPPSILNTVYNSLTLSVSSWIPKVYNERYTEAFEYILNVALPRSWVAIYFLVFSYFLYKYIKYKEFLHIVSKEESDKKFLDKIRTNNFSIEIDDLKEYLEPYSNTIKKVVSIEIFVQLIKLHPSGFIVECRKLTEVIVDDLYNFEFDRLDQNQKINILYKNNLINRITSSNLHSIRILGNIAVHNNDMTINNNDANVALNNLVAIMSYLKLGKSHEK